MKLIKIIAGAAAVYTTYRFGSFVGETNALANLSHAEEARDGAASMLVRSILNDSKEPLTKEKIRSAKSFKEFALMDQAYSIRMLVERGRNNEEFQQTLRGMLDEAMPEYLDYLKNKHENAIDE